MGSVGTAAMSFRDHEGLILAALAPIIAGTRGPAFAQASATCADSKNCPDEATIIVTGTHVPGPQASAAPVQRIDARDIDESGVINLPDLLNQNPIFGQPTLNRTNSNFQTDFAGMATVNLRNLGESRTLVLVNGHRLVPSLPGSDTVDLSVIPTQLVSRVDVLTGGASSIYGSDAIAGVVNIVLDNRFTGLKAEAQEGMTGQGDDVTRQADLSYGTSFASGRGHVVLSAGYSNEGAVFSRSRKRTAVQPLDCFSEEGGDPFAKCGIFLSVFTPQGAVFAGTQNDPVSFTFFGANAIEGDPEGFNNNIDRLLAVPTRRYLLNAIGGFDFSDRLSFSFEGSFARTIADPELEPVPLGSLDVFPENGGRFDIEQDVIGPGGTLVRVRNPFVQDAIFNAATDTDGDGLRDVGFNRRMTEFGNRGAHAVRQMLRGLAGLEGPVGAGWRWNAYYSYGQSTQDQITHGLFDFTRLRQALAVIPDINDVDHDGNVTEPICLSAEARAQGCVPANLFAGAGALAPTFDYLHVDGTSSSRVSQYLAGASMTGPLLRLPGGNLEAAIGAEFRSESTRVEYDPLTQAGLNGGNAEPNITGGFHVTEGYAELIAPILSGRRLAQTLTLRGAARVARYSSIGTRWTWNYGAEYAPVEAVRFRAVRSRAIRAPNIGELFTPQVEFFDLIDDPCEGVTATTPGTLGTVCRSFPGVNANIAANGQFTVTAADKNAITGVFGGNPGLREERSDSLTAGVVLNPLRGLTATVDYFDIKVADAIFGLSDFAVVNQCFNAGISQLCALITRRPSAINGTSPGSLDRIDIRLINSGGLQVKGIDVTANYGRDALGGRLDLSLAYTHLMKGFIVPVASGPEDAFAGEIGSSRDRALTTVSYDRKKWGATLRASYIGPAYIDDQVPGAERTDKFLLGDEIVFDAQLRFTPLDRFQLYLGIDNLLDNAPPFVAGAFGLSPGVNTDAGTYDAIGRRFYVGARVKY